MSLRVRDEITPGLATLARRISDKRPILEAMGVALLSVTTRAFNQPSLRAAPWPAKKDGTPATLRKNQVLVRSWRIASVSQSAVVIGSDRPYAAVHQLGSRKKRGRGSGIPPRPMLPFGADRQMTDLGRRRVEAAARAKIRSMLKGV